MGQKSWNEFQNRAKPCSCFVTMVCSSGNQKSKMYGIALGVNVVIDSQWGSRPLHSRIAPAISNVARASRRVKNTTNQPTSVRDCSQQRPLEQPVRVDNSRQLPDAML